MIPPLAFITPWYGAGIPGGMEAETRRLTRTLAAAGLEVEVWTTCIRDFFADWGKNYHAPGVTEEHGVVVRRFPVEERDAHAFNQVNGRLMARQPISPAEEQIFFNEMFHAPDLYAYIEAHSHPYLLFFIPYLFATTVYGLASAPQRSFVIPCLHDEAYARLPLLQARLASARGLLFLTEPEARLADRLIPPSHHQLRQTVGAGVDTRFTFNAQRFRQTYGIDDPFVLYVGRKDAGKNVPLLIDYFRAYKATQPARSRLKLVLVGEGQVGLAPDVIDLGFLPVQDKQDAYAAASIFCQPSVHESFSIVLMESWLTETPALVHGGCAVTVDHCRRAQGGLYFENPAEFGAALDYLLSRTAVAQQMGANGRTYVLANFQPADVLQRYLTLIQAAASA